MIEIEGVIAGGHDHGEVMVFGECADAGLGDEVRMVARDAVQQEKRLERALADGIGGSHVALVVMAQVVVERHGVTRVVDRQDDIEGCGAHERGGEIVNGNACQGTLLSWSPSKSGRGARPCPGSAGPLCRREAGDGVLPHLSSFQAYDETARLQPSPPRGRPYCSVCGPCWRARHHVRAGRTGAGLRIATTRYRFESS